MALLGLDLGTSGVKAAVFDAAGRVLGYAYEEYPLYLPHAGWIELDSDQCWAATQRVIAAAVAAAGSRVQAMSISCHGEAVTPVAADGRALARSIVTFDNRTVEQAAWWAEHYGAARFYQVTGHALHPMGTIHKIMWWREHQPEVFAAARWFLCYEDLVWYRLGLSPAMGTSLAARTMAFDLHAGDWSDELLGLAGIERSRLARAVPAGTVVGVVSAPELGLDGVLAVAGGHDQAVCALGGGAIKPGQAVNTIGTAEVVTPCLGSAVLSPELQRANLACYPHSAPGRYVALGIVAFSSGALVKWYKDQLGLAERLEAERQARNVYEVMIESASDGPSPVLVLPHFSGTGTPALDPLATGAFVGLTLGTTRADIIKGIYDSLAYEMKQNLDVLTRAGVPVTEVRALGGGSRSDRALQLKADILGIPIAAADVPEAGCLGAAILAGTAAGVYGSVEEGVAATVRTRAEFTPRAGETARYAERYGQYLQLYGRLKGAV